MKTFIKKIKLKLELVTVRFFITVSLWMKWPALTAVIFTLAARRVNQSGERTVLCMRRSIFMDDVRAMAKFGGRIHYLVLGRENLRQVLAYFVGEPEMEKITQHNYYTENHGQAGKEKYYEYLKKVWPIFQKLKKFDAVLYSNFCYVEQQELARACGDLGIPLIVLFKEGVVSPGTHVTWAKKAHEGFQFHGQAKMLVYNEDIKKAMATINVPGLSADKMVVVGVPRMDRYFKEQANKNQQKQITFFSAYFRNLLPLLEDDKSRHEELAAKFDDFHRLVMEFASDHPEIRVIIKTKAAKFFLNYILDIMHKNFKTKINNLKIVNYGDPVEMIKNSDVVIGFGSTVLVEALAADKTIISFDLFGALSNNTFDYFRDYPGLVNYVKTKEDLEEVILNYEKYNQRDPERRARFLEEFLYIPDDQSSMRAEQAIIQTIESYYNH